MPDRSEERREEDELIENILAGMIGAVLDHYGNHMPEYQVYHAIRLLGPAMLKACKNRGIDDACTSDITITYPHPN